MGDYGDDGLEGTEDRDLPVDDEVVRPHGPARMKFYPKGFREGEIVGHAFNGMPPPETPDEEAATVARFAAERHKGRWR